MPKVYIKTDSESRIIAVDSSNFLPDTTSWIQIDAGEGDKYTHAQSNYFPLPLTTENGVYQYKLVDGKPVERTAEEMAEDERSEPNNTPTAEERLEALEAAILEMMMGGITE